MQNRRLCQVKCRGAYTGLFLAQAQLRQIVHLIFVRIRYDMGSTAGGAAAPAEGPSYTTASGYRARSAMEHSVRWRYSKADSLGQVACLFGRSSALQKANRLARTPTQCFLMPRSLDMATAIVRHP